MNLREELEELVEESDEENPTILVNSRYQRELDRHFNFRDGGLALGGVIEIDDSVEDYDIE